MKENALGVSPSADRRRQFWSRLDGLLARQILIERFVFENNSSSSYCLQPLAIIHRKIRDITSSLTYRQDDHHKSVCYVEWNNRRNHHY